MRTDYGKPIRDRIPELLEAEGLRYEVARLDDDAFRAALLAKLREEAGEVATAAFEARTVELADLFEVVDALLALEGIDHERVLAEQARRRFEGGGFERRLDLRWTV